MGLGKKILKPRVIAATTVVLVGVLVAANIIATQKYSSLIDNILGGQRPVLSKEELNITFKQDFDSKREAFDNGNKVTKEICEEGMILLKNDNDALPLKANAKVSVFGKNSVRLVTGGSGSAEPGASGSAADKTAFGWRKTIFDSLKDAHISYNETLMKFYKNNNASGKGRPANPKMENSGVPTLETGETPYSSYTDAVKKSYDKFGDAALVVVSRIAGENWDLPRKASDDPTRHYLQLDTNERELIKQIGESGKFKSIILLLNGSNYIDLGFLYERTNSAEYNEYGKYIDGVINIGSPGANGIMALGEILTGKVNPSGHTVDTVYTAYQNDPTWQNFGGNFTDGGDIYMDKNGANTKYYGVEYEENIYMGYRYYETRGAIEGEDWYNANVVYPFGYGLSYTKFSQEIVNTAALEAAPLTYGENDEFNVEIKVKNIEGADGKQVVQLYAEAPYTAGGIEKAHKVLVGFAKTDTLKPGEEQTVTISVDPYYIASFDNHDANTNGFKGYELEKGTYTFHAGTDAHHDFATFTKELAADVQIDKDPITNNTVEPLFDDVTIHMVESLSRADFAGTFPHTITDAERRIDDDMLTALRSKTHNNPDIDQYTSVPTMGADNGLVFKQMAGLAYNDPLWEQFLDQMTFDEMIKLVSDGCYKTTDILRLGIPETKSCDGPTGLVSFLDKTGKVYGACYYMSECLLAQTYNVKLAEKQGNAIGNECLIGNERGDSLAYPGWYAPGVNLHRSPFSGRNTEYYSEDPFLNGRFAGKVIKAVQEKGVYANVKHYALNDQETHRSAYGIATWCDEQAMRELYLRPFEMAVKEGETRGLMTSFNRVGTTWAGGDYRLCTTVLRKEWGFVGSVICDFHTDAYMDSKQMLYAGGDMNLCADSDLQLQVGGKGGVSATNAADVNILRLSSHNNLFVLANSAAMKAEVLYYKPAIWRIALVGADIGIGVALATWGFFAFFTLLRVRNKNKEEAAAE